MSGQTTMKWTTIAQAEPTIALVLAGNLESLLDDVFWFQFPRERKEVLV